MTVRLDQGVVERAAAGCSLRLPRGPHRGKLGEVRAASVGSSLELHDFRQYQPGDDLRQIDWNAVARTGELYLRVRQDEVSPRVEVLVDGSASMRISEEKAARAREVAAWVCALARRGGLDPVVIATGSTVRKAGGPAIRAMLESLEFDGREPFDVGLRRAPPLLPCGLRVVVSDFLFDSAPEPFSERLARGASGLALVQVLDPEDLDPSGGAGARLTDSESGEVLERILTPGVVDQYLARLAAHVSLWQGAARRVRASWSQASAEFQLDALARRELHELVEVA
ncbi:MAG: DUF58 domain-containing protein [Archangium sp.]|nr:DUF58 domain-containing protein [Archangium sp.]